MPASIDANRPARRRDRGAALTLLLIVLAAAPARAADGELDPTFGSGAGARALAYDLGAPFEDACGDLAASPDGTLLVGGTSNSQFSDFDWMVSRLAPSGVILLSRQFFFDLGGSNEDRLGAVAFDAGGRALVAGSARAPDRREIRVCRLIAATLGNDPSFNGGACVALDLGASTEMDVRRVAPAPDGGILVAGSLLQPAQPSPDLNWYVLKLTSTGALDGTFAFFGVRVLAWNADGLSPDRLFDMAVDPRSGAIFLAGEMPYAPTGRSGRLAKLTPGGNLDLSFGVGGYQDLVLAPVGVPLKTSADALALDPVTGTIWVALHAEDPAGTHLAQTGVEPTGGLSQPTEFTWSFGDTSSRIRRLVRQSDGRLLVAGDSISGGAFFATRFVPFAPTFAELDLSFANGSTMAFYVNDLGWGSGRQHCSATLDAGRLAFSGDSNRGDIDQIVARLTNGLIFEDRFETGDTLEWSATTP